MWSVFLRFTDFDNPFVNSFSVKSMLSMTRISLQIINNESKMSNMTGDIDG
jgi:hypothetical protein